MAGVTGFKGLFNKLHKVRAEGDMFTGKPLGVLSEELTRWNIKLGPIEQVIIGAGASKPLDREKEAPGQGVDSFTRKLREKQAAGG